MPRLKKCPSNLCGHREYMDYSDKTCTPEPYCPECMKQIFVPETESDEEEEVY